jgi:hypothetical protein
VSWKTYQWLRGKLPLAICTGQSTLAGSPEGGAVVLMAEVFVTVLPADEVEDEGELIRL